MQHGYQIHLVRWRYESTGVLYYWLYHQTKSVVSWYSCTDSSGDRFVHKIGTESRIYRRCWSVTAPHIALFQYTGISTRDFIGASCFLFDGLAWSLLFAYIRERVLDRNRTISGKIIGWGNWSFVYRDCFILLHCMRIVDERAVNDYNKPAHFQWYWWSRSIAIFLRYWWWENPSRWWSFWSGNGMWWWSSSSLQQTCWLSDAITFSQSRVSLFFFLRIPQSGDDIAWQESTTRWQPTSHNYISRSTIKRSVVISYRSSSVFFSYAHSSFVCCGPSYSGSCYSSTWSRRHCREIRTSDLDTISSLDDCIWYLSCESIMEWRFYTNANATVMMSSFN